MARTFRRQRQAHPIAELNVTNLIDLGFTLLIIFMIATQSTSEQTIPIKLPLESRSPQVKPAENQQFVAISVDVSGSFFIGNDRTPLSLGELRERLREYGIQPKPPVIRIRGDGQVPYEKIILLMDELKKANLTQVSFDTQTEG